MKVCVTPGGTLLSNACQLEGKTISEHAYTHRSLRNFACGTLRSYADVAVVVTEHAVVRHTAPRRWADAAVIDIDIVLVCIVECTETESS